MSCPAASSDTLNGRDNSPSSPHSLLSGEGYDGGEGLNRKLAFDEPAHWIPAFDGTKRVDRTSAMTEPAQDITHDFGRNDG